MTSPPRLSIVAARRCPHPLPELFAGEQLPEDGGRRRIDALCPFWVMRGPSLRPAITVTPNRRSNVRAARSSQAPSNIGTQRPSRTAMWRATSAREAKLRWTPVMTNAVFGQIQPELLPFFSAPVRPANAPTG